MSEIRIYTDGACKGNPGPGGWAWNKNSKFAPSFFRERLRKQSDTIPEAPPITGPMR